MRFASPHVILDNLIADGKAEPMIVVIPNGRAIATAAMVAGQMIMSVVLDHTNTLVAQQHSFNLYRLLGIAMIIGGVVILRKF